MVATVKFSQFLDGGNVLAGDTIVGLRGGVNTKFLFTGGGGGGGGGVIVIIQQPPGALVVGDWVRVNAGGLYVVAQADTPQNAETLGLIIATSATTITIQQSGYITTAQAVFAGLVTGDVYFLDTLVAGNMVPIDATVNGTVSRPVFVADSPTSGWVVPYRGLVVGGAAPQGGGGGGTNPNIVNVHQNNHMLNLGDVVRLNGSINYVQAFADTLANAQAVGVVIDVIDVNNFVLQTSGYFSNAPIGVNAPPFSVDDIGVALVPATIYYLSSLIPGRLTSVPPIFTKPIFDCEQVWGTTGVNAGYIFEQRPLTGFGGGGNITEGDLIIYAIMFG